MAIAVMTTVIAKPSPCNGLHVLSSADSKRSFLPSRPCFHPLRSVDNEHGTNHYNLSFMKLDQRKKLHMVVQCSGLPIPPPAAPTSPFSGLPGKGWIIGIALSLFLPFMKNKWGPLILLKKEVDTTLERVEETVEVVEKVAVGVEKTAENIEEELPQGQLRNAVSMIEQSAERADTAAHFVDDTVHRIDKLEETFEASVEAEITSRQTNAKADNNKLEKAEEEGKIEKAK